MDYLVKAYKDWKFHSQFQEIVPDMDDEYMFNEKQSIRESSRSLKKYGSTCCNKKLSPNETLIRHDIDKTDTLQGIALKYECTTEQIRRANRLFASDSLFLRQYLLVPVDKSSPFYPKTDANNFRPTNQETPTTTTVTSNQNITSNDPRPSALPTRPYSIAGELLALPNADDSNNSGSSSSSSSKQSKSLDSVAAMTPEEENRKCMNEFLNKIDTTILESRKYVEKSKEMITSQSDDDLFVTSDVVQRRRNQQLNNSYKNRLPQHTTNHTRHSSSGSTSDTVQLLHTTQTRLVQNSLKRLEKQQDEFFEL